MVHQTVFTLLFTLLVAWRVPSLGLGEGLVEEERRGSTGSFLLFTPVFSLGEGSN